MARFIKDRKKTRGMQPGSLVFIGRQKMEKTRIRLIDYNAENLAETEIENTDQLKDVIKSPEVSWINIDGLHDTKIIREIGSLLGIHPLHLEDIVNTDQRPRFEESNTYLLFILKMLDYDKSGHKIHSEQISVILTKNCILTFQEQIGDYFEPVRERIRNSKGRIRNSGNDYLAYAILDTIVDNYMILVGEIGAKVEELEPKILTNPKKELVQEIYSHKMELNFLRKSIRPVRDMVYQFLRSESDIVDEKSMVYLRDLNDLVIHATETIEIYHSIISDQLNIYNTNISNRMNEVMKVLTIFAAIFIPLTFLAGIYGMNFENIPELSYKYGYFIFWIIILVISFLMIIYFRKKRWM